MDHEGGFVEQMHRCLVAFFVKNVAVVINEDEVGCVNELEMHAEGVDPESIGLDRVLRLSVRVTEGEPTFNLCTMMNLQIHTHSGSDMSSDTFVVSQITYHETIQITFLLYSGLRNHRENTPNILSACASLNFTNALSCSLSVNVGGLGTPPIAQPCFKVLELPFCWLCAAFPF